MATTNITPVSFRGDVTVTLEFWGPDEGEWPAAKPAGSQQFTFQADDANFDPNDEHVDFKSGQHLHRLMRLIGRGHELSFNAKFVTKNILLGGFVTYGPLVKCIITSDNAIVAADAGDTVLTFFGIMKSPSIHFGDPSQMQIGILPYGKDYTIGILTVPTSSDNYWAQVA